jgi:hypothetical protein
LVDEYKEAGLFTVQWDGRDKSGRVVSSGVYLYNMTSGNFAKSRKMVLLK